MEEGVQNDEGLNVDDIDTSALTPEMKAILDSIDTSDTAQENAQNALSQAIES
jgi:hypothetical protein